MLRQGSWMFIFFNDTATTEIYTLSLHDALPICERHAAREAGEARPARHDPVVGRAGADRVRHPEVRDLGPRPSQARGTAVDRPDRKSTRLNSSHANISYAVFCLKKKTHDFYSHI